MITNKNNIVIAPTYIIISIKPKNSKFIVINKPELLINIETNQNTEWIGFILIIIMIAELMITKEKKIKSWSIK